MNINRKIKRNQEKNYLKVVKSTYGTKPKEKCPKCNKKSLFMKDKQGNLYCVRCNNIVKIS